MSQKKTKKKAPAKKRRGMGASGSSNMLMSGIIGIGAAVAAFWGIKKYKEGITDPTKLADFSANLKKIYGAMFGGGLLGLWKLRDPRFRFAALGIGAAGAIGYAIEEQWISVGSMSDVPFIAAYRTGQQQRMISGQGSDMQSNTAAPVTTGGSQRASVQPVISGGMGIFNQRRGR